MNTRTLLIPNRCSFPGDSANELDSKGAKEVPVDGDNYGDPKHSGGACDNSTAEVNDCEADLDTENKEKNAQIDNSRECRGENSPDGTFKPVRTNVKIHNPPGGKSSFSLY